MRMALHTGGALACSGQGGRGRSGRRVLHRHVPSCVQAAALCAMAAAWRLPVYAQRQESDGGAQGRRGGRTMWELAVDSSASSALGMQV